MKRKTNYKLLNLSYKNQWNDYLKLLPKNQQDVYFTPEYYSLYEQNGDGEANCFVFEKEGNIVLYPFLKNSINELGYSLDKEYYDIQGAYGYNGILTNSADSDFIDLFHQYFNDYCLQNNIIAEFSRFHPLLGNQDLSVDHFQIIFDRETVALDLTQDYESIWKNEYSSKNRNMIRKAQKDGSRIEIISNPDSSQIDTFIEIYNHSMKMVKADEYYYFKRDFFFNTFSLLKKNVFLFNVFNSNDDVVCSSIFFHYGKFFHYHLSGRSELANNTVNNFLLDEAVKYAKEIGAEIFHFGGGISSDADDRLLKFKTNFSKTRLPFYIGKKIHNKIIYDEVVRQWEEDNPEMRFKYKSYLLKYRY